MYFMGKKFVIPVDKDGGFGWIGAAFRGELNDDGSVFIENLLPDEAARVWKAANRRQSVNYLENALTPSKMRRFVLSRQEDISGVSGTGIVAEGVLFASGQAVVSWLTERRSVVIWNNFDDVEAVHGHGGATKIEWID
jgi:hypothetical protein